MVVRSGNSNVGLTIDSIVGSKSCNAFENTISDSGVSRLSIKYHINKSISRVCRISNNK